MKPFTQDVIRIVQQIPEGKVLTYGLVAVLAGHPGAARQVAGILHVMSGKHRLPWHRVINARGRISLPSGRGYEEQKALLVSEGVVFHTGDQVDFDSCLMDTDCLVSRG